MQTYCLVCKKATYNANSRVVKTKGRLQMKSICTICGNKESRFISQGSGLFDMLGLNTPENNRKKAILSRYGYHVKTLLFIKLIKQIT